MAKTKVQKQDLLTTLKERWSRTKSMVFSDYTGLKVNELEDLRRSLKEKGGEYMVVKKTILKKLFADENFTGTNPREIPGELGVAFGYEDEIAPAKVLAEMSKKYEALKISGGLLEGNFIATAKVMELAKLPSRDVLIAKVVGSIKAPITGFVGVMKGNLRNLVGVLNAIAQEKN